MRKKALMFALEQATEKLSKYGIIATTENGKPAVYIIDSINTFDAVIDKGKKIYQITDDEEVFEAIAKYVKSRAKFIKDEIVGISTDYALLDIDETDEILLDNWIACKLVFHPPRSILDDEGICYLYRYTWKHNWDTDMLDNLIQEIAKKGICLDERETHTRLFPRIDKLDAQTIEARITFEMDNRCVDEYANAVKKLSERQFKKTKKQEIKEIDKGIERLNKITQENKRKKKISLGRKKQLDNAITLEIRRKTKKNTKNNKEKNKSSGIDRITN